MTEHEKWLLDQYNRNRPMEEWVYSMAELNRKMLDIEVRSHNGNGVDKDHDEDI